MVWEAEVVVVFIGILAPPAALFGVPFRFTIHTTQMRIKTKVKTPITRPITNLLATLASERQMKETST